MHHLPESARLVFTGRIITRWGDMDALGHVNNSVYLTYFEQTRIDWLAAHPPVWTDREGPVVAEATVRYRRPIVAPATVLVRLYAEAPRRSSILTHYEVFTEEQPDVLFATGQVVMVWVDYSTGRPVSLPALFHDLWNASDPA